MTTTETPSNPGVDMRHQVARHLKQYLKAEGAFRRQNDDDPEIVHDARVAARRLRAALDASDAKGSTSWLRALRRSAKRAGRALGPVRDADVQLALLASERDAAASSEQPGIDRLMARLQRDQAAGTAQALAALSDPDQRANLDNAKRRLKGKASKGSAKNTESSGAVDTGRIEKPLEALLASAEASRESTTPAALHEQRIAAKKLRYTIELDEATLGEPGKDAIATLREVQDTLGELHDLDVLLELARDELRAVADEEAALALTGKAPPARNADRRGLLAFMARVAKERHERAAAFERHWDSLLANGLEEQIRTLAPGEKNPSESPD